MTHPVNEIADAIVAILRDQTWAEHRVFRDREPDLEVRGELPAIVVHVGADDPVDQQVHGRWRSDVRINVDLFMSSEEDQVSRDLLDLRTVVHRLIMGEEPNLGLPQVIRIVPGGAEEILRAEGSLAVAYLRTAWFISYQHSFTDPAL